jgi:3alpha(or 20beta)-hydroxysteroid dehydrogenase
MGKLADHIAIVSGGARGLGAVIADELARDGAQVYVGDVLESEGHRLAERLGPNVEFLPLDVTAATGWARVIATVLERHGRIDVLVNNAGRIHHDTVEQFSLEAWRSVLDVNLTGTFLGIQSVVPAMKKSGRGSIVNVASLQANVASARNHAYVASKFGVRGLTKSSAVELASYGIRVNSVHPGMIETPMTADLDPSSIVIPMNRAGTPLEVARAVVFLASEDSSYITGGELVVDGGTLAAFPRR